TRLCQGIRLAVQSLVEQVIPQVRNPAHLCPYGRIRRVVPALQRFAVDKLVVVGRAGLDHIPP
ncbi:MAG: hypothetical protein Q4B48_08745, partial [Syntrophomonadaceae bacterium]|nr:hypothetical protein [Syntrophomonadaceae bacterium]